MSFTARIERPSSFSMILPSLLLLSWKGTHVDLSAPVERGPSQSARSGSTGPTWVSFQSLSPCAFCEQEGHLAAPYPLIPSSLAPRSSGWPDWSPTARDQKISLCSLKGSLVDPRLRASNEHIPIVRVPRAGGRLGCPSHPSETSRCASTGASTGPPPILFPL